MARSAITSKPFSVLNQYDHPIGYLICADGIPAAIVIRDQDKDEWFVEHSFGWDDCAHAFASFQAAQDWIAEQMGDDEFVAAAALPATRIS